MNHRLGVRIQVLSIGTFIESLVLPLGMEELRQGLITCRYLIIQRVRFESRFVELPSSPVMLGTPLAKMEHEKFGLVGGVKKDLRRWMSTVPRTGISSMLLCSPLAKIAHEKSGLVKRPSTDILVATFPSQFQGLFHEAS